MLALAEKEMLLDSLTGISSEEVMNAVSLYASVRTLLLSGVPAFQVTQTTANYSKNAERILINGVKSPLIVHGPHGYSPHRSGKATAFHHEDVGQNIGDVSIHSKKRTLTLNLLFGHGHESTESIEGKLTGWLFCDEGTRRKAVLKDISASSDLSQLILGLTAWRRIWFS